VAGNPNVSGEISPKKTPQTTTFKKIA